MTTWPSSRITKVWFYKKHSTTSNNFSQGLSQSIQIIFFWKICLWKSLLNFLFQEYTGLNLPNFYFLRIHNSNLNFERPCLILHVHTIRSDLQAGIREHNHATETDVTVKQSRTFWLGINFVRGLSIREYLDVFF